MSAILVVAAIAVIGAVIARVTWRRPADERHSIQNHQQALDTLRSMADRRPGAPRAAAAGGAAAPPRPSRSREGHVQTGPTQSGSLPSGPEGSAPARSAPARSGSARPGPVRASSSSGGAGREELVFVDDAGASPASRADGSPRISPLSSSKGLHRSGGVDRLSGPRRGGTVGRVLPVAAAVVVLGLVVGVAVALAPSHHRTRQAQGTTPRTRATGQVSRHAKVTAPAQVQPATATASTASYGAPSTSYTVNLQATGPCWVYATKASTGAVVWTGTLQTGQTQAIAATGSLIVRLGAANDVNVTMNGTPVVLPTGFQSPFDMHFQAT